MLCMYTNSGTVPIIGLLLTAFTLYIVFQLHSTSITTEQGLVEPQRDQWDLQRHYPSRYPQAYQDSPCFPEEEHRSLQVSSPETHARKEQGTSHWLR